MIFIDSGLSGKFGLKTSTDVSESWIVLRLSCSSFAAKLAVCDSVFCSDEISDVRCVFGIAACGIFGIFMLSNSYFAAISLSFSFSGTAVVFFIRSGNTTAKIRAAAAAPAVHFEIEKE